MKINVIIYVAKQFMIIRINIVTFIMRLMVSCGSKQTEINVIIYNNANNDNNNN